MEEKFEDVLAEMFFEVVVEATHVHVVAAARRLRAVLDEADLFELRKFSPLRFRSFTRTEITKINFLKQIYSELNWATTK